MEYSGIKQLRKKHVLVGRVVTLGKTPVSKKLGTVYKKKKDASFPFSLCHHTINHLFFQLPGEYYSKI